MVQNKALIFKKVPDGFPKAGEHLTIEDRPVDLNFVPAGGLIIKNCYASFDPYQRGRMRDASIKSYAPPFTLDKPVTTRVVSEVVKSNNDGFKEGDVVVGDAIGTEEYSVLDAEATKRVRTLQNPYNIDPKVFLGALGMPGLTAYSSFYDIGQPKKGETIFVSAGSGAVGQLVSQLAKHEGLHVIVSVGDDRKLEYMVKDLGVDSAFNYKKEKAADALKRLAPDGIDIYYENVGGETLEAAIAAMKPFGRIIACGMISQYNLPPEQQYGVKNLVEIVGRRIKIQGFIVGDPNMGPRYAKEHQERVQKWISEGSFHAKTDVTVGIDNAAQGLLGIFEGKNFGKAILQISELRDNHDGVRTSRA